jgi:integrase
LLLTDIAIKKLAPTDKRREIRDDGAPGLYLIVQPNGKRSWAVRYAHGGRGKKLTLGSYPAITLGEARKRALMAVAQVAGGADPAAQKKAAREAAKAAYSASDRVADVVAAYVRDYVTKRVKPSWARETERALRKEVLPVWGKRRLGEITDDHVYALLKTIADRPAPFMSNRLHAVLHKLFSWAMSREGGRLIKTNPCAGFELPGGEERKRDRVLTDAEIKAVWQAFEAIGWPHGPIGKLLLLTGARRDEVRSMEWRELDLDAKVWRIPGERTKNGQPHEIPLSDTALEILGALLRIGSTLVFTTTGKTPVSGFSRAKTQIDALVTAPDWRIHDLRRTVATNLQKLGIRLEVTEAVLNHVSGSRAGIVGVYQRHSWADEKRAALEAWSRRLDEIVSGEVVSNVVALKR